MPKGTPEEIKKEVKRRISILGKGGGYIVAPTHNIQDDTPVENIDAFFETVMEYGEGKEIKEFTIFDNIF
jgi:uroporphyrinogen decarboxylase